MSHALEASNYDKDPKKNSVYNKHKKVQQTTKMDNTRKDHSMSPWDAPSI